ncbi:MAG: class I SAM-dependent methyltransferase [Solirubrobacteraceae bacterium]
MISPLRMYGDGLLGGAGSGARQQVRLIDGSAIPLELERFLSPADAIDEQLLEGLHGPVLDVGCGPGRHLHALASAGVFALGVDLSPVAVGLAIGGGGRAIVGDIFDELPGDGWQSALLLDGNIGIGGAPVRLLARVADLLDEAGVMLVELGAPGTWTGATQARLESPHSTSGWFPWARVAAGAIGPVARAGGFQTTRVWSLGGRWFARLHRGRETAGRRQLGRQSAARLSIGPSARAGSVP